MPVKSTYFNPEGITRPSYFMPVYSNNGPDKQMDENVPKTNPNKIGKLKSKMTLPPKMHNTAREINDVNAVSTVLDNVSFMLRFSTSLIVILPYFRKFSRTLSKTTTVSCIE